MYIPYIFPQRDTLVTTNISDKLTDAQKLQVRLCVADMPRIALDFPYMTEKDAKRLKFDPEFLYFEFVRPNLIKNLVQKTEGQMNKLLMSCDFDKDEIYYFIKQFEKATPHHFLSLDKKLQKESSTWVFQNYQREFMS